VTQTMATLLSGAEPDTAVKTEVIGDAPELRCETLRGRDDEILIAVWSAIEPGDDEYQGARVTLKVEAEKPRRVEAVDTLHGLVQAMTVKQLGGWIEIDDVLVTDYPVLLRMELH